MVYQQGASSEAPWHIALSLGSIPSWRRTGVRTPPRPDVLGSYALSRNYFHQGSISREQSRSLYGRLSRWVIPILALIPPCVVPARLHSSVCGDFVIDGLRIMAVIVSDEGPLSAVMSWFS